MEEDKDLPNSPAPFLSPPRSTRTAASTRGTPQAAPDTPQSWASPNREAGVPARKPLTPLVAASPALPRSAGLGRAPAFNISQGTPLRQSAHKGKRNAAAAGLHGSTTPRRAVPPLSPTSLPGTPASLLSRQQSVTSPNRGNGGGGDGGGGDDDGGGGGGGHNSDDEHPTNNGGAAGAGALSGAVIWGTNVDVDDTMDRFRLFITGFTEQPAAAAADGAMSDEEEAPPPEPIYMAKLRDIHRDKTHSMDVNCIDLYKFERGLPAKRRLYEQLLQYPQEMIPIMDLVTHQVFTNEYGEEALGNRRIQVRPYNLRRLRLLRGLDPKDIDQLVALRGMVTRTSPIIPDIKQAYFKCAVCNAAVEVAIDRGRIEEPSRCDSCGLKNTLELQHNRCLFTDKQMVRLQETPDEIPDGETPQSVSLFGYDDLVDAVRPGDRVELTGIFRAVPKRPNPKQRTVRSVYKTYIDIVHICTTSTDALGAGKAAKDVDSAAVAPARLAAFRELAEDPDVYEKLTAAIAPSIWELEDVKRGVLCQLFGGNDRAAKDGDEQKKREEGEDGMDVDEQEEESEAAAGGVAAAAAEAVKQQQEKQEQQQKDDDAVSSTRGNRRRGEINVLLCGDPGTSKSQLLGFVHKIAPRGIYTSGKGSSAVGLTASVVRDTETRELVLESGALVLSDNGICCIDEFDKMSDTTRAVLHEAMEQQTVSVAKAGIVCTLNARAAILASANPLESRYNPRLSVVENIRLPPTLLSRFDLIYLVLDRPNPDGDRRLARHLVGLYRETPEAREPPIELDFLRDYIAYARRYVQPRIGEEAANELVRGYLDMRRMGGRGNKTITATPRQLESLIRLSEALARMRLGQWVEPRDVAEAIRLMRVATQTAATDPRTGTIDMDMINTGRGAVDREAVRALSEEISGLLGGMAAGARMSVEELRRRLAEQSDAQITNSDVNEAVQLLADDGAVHFHERAQMVVVRG